MEFFNYRKQLGVIQLLLAMSILLLLISCSSNRDEEFILENSSVDVRSLPTVGEVITLSNGETIVLQDTTTHVFYLSDLVKGDNNGTLDFANSVVGLASDVIQMREYGYDSRIPETTDWLKGRFVGFEEYGVPSNTVYIARFEEIHKDLSIQKNYTVLPNNYQSEDAPKNCMGLLPGGSGVGFIANKSSKSEYVMDGVTRILFINCDLSGIQYNKSVPADPNNFVWYYRLISDEGQSWD